MNTLFQPLGLLLFSDRVGLDGAAIRHIRHIDLAWIALNTAAADGKYYNYYNGRCYE
ncbi:hypothetical protein ACQ86N_44135 [Puia sp. P3]|uniref:hypothetical protein n=1 Tax=Puia sp. P3 TaxID=3423952 RepID=UPI003D66E9CB